jgi:hypothetical protein
MANLWDKIRKTLGMDIGDIVKKPQLTNSQKRTIRKIREKYEKSQSLKFKLGVIDKYEKHLKKIRKTHELEGGEMGWAYEKRVEIKTAYEKRK